MAEDTGMTPIQMRTVAKNGSKTSPNARPVCEVCGKPAVNPICAACSDKIRAEALARKRREDKGLE